MCCKQVLIIEDNLDILEAMQLAIEFEGYTVFTASNGQQALEVLLTVKTLPCLILLDLMMPVMDGWAFAEEISKDRILATIPIVVVSAFTDKKNTPKNAREALEKPIDFDLLLKIIGEYCG